ncbi:MAG TPA: class I adenylate-forming enzyme family protein [Acidimicrobiia bacterium]|nr:class I adenylate-forming enzyme family protein [Acidimicrobiia bacterium]
MKHDGQCHTVDDVLREVAAALPTRVAYVDGDRTITYAELDRAVGGCATALRAAGVGHGDVVVLLLRSSIEFAVTYLGAIRIGAITSAINLRLGPGERRSIVARSAPRLVVAEDDVEVPDDGVAPVVRRVTLPAAFASEPLPIDRHVALQSHDPVAIVWTSGTTGAPKGAVYDHGAMREISIGMGELTEPGDRRLSVTPFPHVGYMTRVWDELANGTTLVLTGDPWSASEHLRCLAEERITVAAGVPTQWSWILDHPDAATIDTSHLRIASIGAASVPPELVRRMRETLGCPVIVRYTSTEAGLLTGTRLGDPDDVVAATVGRPSPVVDMRVVDPDTDEQVTPGTVGEVRCRSRAMFTGYWNDADATAAAFDVHGYLKTGDLGALGADGNLRLVGRRSDMYIRGGFNVYPVEVEAALAEHPAVARAAVVGTPHPALGEVGVAFVVLDPQAEPIDETETLREWCRARLAGYKAPERVIVVPELPVTAMMKVDKRALAERATEEA